MILIFADFIYERMLPRNVMSRKIVQFKGNNIKDLPLKNKTEKFYNFKSGDVA